MGRKILIIDDEDDIREVASLSLETVAGWEVIKASSGAQGVARAAEQRPDAILLDVMMPGMDGPATFRELRKNPATAAIPVLLLTAKVQGTDQRRFADLGVEAVLFKPFDPWPSRADFTRAGMEVTAIRRWEIRTNPPSPTDATIAKALDTMWARYRTADSRARRRP